MRTGAHIGRAGAAICLFAFGVAEVSGQVAGIPNQVAGFPKRTGVQTPGVQQWINELPKAATIVVRGEPDWLTATLDAVWVTSEKTDSVVRLDAATSRAGTVVTVHKPCSGLAVGFGSLWVPSCGDKSVVRVDASTGAVQATIPAGPADSEGGITTGAGSVWLVTSEKSELTRIDAGDK